MKGRFITLEGIDGAGKSTQLDWLVRFLQGRGIEVVATREPGGTKLGERLRELLLNEPMHLETETLLMFAARREHLDKRIWPALEAGQWVVSDRFSDASHAYQGGGRGLAHEKLVTLERWVQGDFQPDLSLFFDLPAELATQRLKKTGAPPDRFEQETQAFFERVRAAYRQRAADEPQRIHLIDARQSPQEIQKSLEKIIVSNLFR